MWLKEEVYSRREKIIKYLKIFQALFGENDKREIKSAYNLIKQANLINELFVNIVNHHHLKKHPHVLFDYFSPETIHIWNMYSVFVNVTDISGRFFLLYACQSAWSIAFASEQTNYRHPCSRQQRFFGIWAGF